MNNAAAVTPTATVSESLARGASSLVRGTQSLVLSTAIRTQIAGSEFATEYARVDALNKARMNAKLADLRAKRDAVRASNSHAMVPASA